MSQQSLSGNLEELVLTALCWDTDLATQIVLQTDSVGSHDLFTTRHYRTIAKASIQFIKDYQEAPKGHIADVLETELNKGEHSGLIWKQINRMEELSQQINPAYVINELTEFVATHRMRVAIDEASIAINKGDRAKAEEALNKVDSATQHTPGIWMNDPDAALSFLRSENETDKMHLGIEALDSRGICPARKEVFCYLAPKARGKSMALVNAGKYAAYIERKNVLHITLEMSAEKTAKRYVQSLCGWTASEHDHQVRVPIFERDDVGNYEKTSFENVIPAHLNMTSRDTAAGKILSLSRGQKKLLIKEFPTGVLTTSQLILFLDYLKKVEKFEPDMLILDYATLMYMNPQHIRTEVGRIFKELRGIAVARNMAVVTATQGNRASDSAKVVSATHTAEDWSIMGTVDIGVSICQTPEEKERRLARLFVMRARNESDGFLVMITQAFEMCQFSLDSIYMNRVAARDFERLSSGEDSDDD